jgi:hypothetical protein
MRKVESSVVVRQAPRDVWARLSRPEAWQHLTEAFAGRTNAYRYVVVGDPRGVLGVGSDVDVQTPKGKPIMRWRVSEWAPPSSLELSVNEAERMLTPFHMLLRFQLEELDDDATRLTASLVIVYMNRLLEILSLVLPVGFMYSRGLNRALASFKASFS